MRQDRLVVVDALRGFAVVAIMLLHFIEHFIYGVYPTATPTDTALWDALFFLFAGKSYTIFALLFGLTYAIQYQNQRSRSSDFSWRFGWRMVLLMGFATLNAAFFPGGDVLMLFAVMGGVMIAVRRLSVKWLLVVACLFLVQPVEIYYTIATMLNPDFSIPTVLTDALYPTLKTAVDSGSWWQMVGANIWTGQVASLAWAVDAGRLLQAPGLFILGMVLLRSRLFENTERSNSFWVRAFIVAAMSAFTLFVLKSSVENFAPLKTIATMWYNIAFTAVLVSGFVILYRHAIFAHLVSGLTFYGRMSLTNYISQSIIGSLIFFPYALGLAPVLGVTASFLVGICVMVVQLRFSRYWFANHRLGPLEGVWHRMTWMRWARR